MIGMNRQTGAPITDELADIRQSIEDIVTTPIGTRVMRRDYGSILPMLIDRPLNDATLLQAYAASVIAIQRWEDRVAITRVGRSASSETPGGSSLEFEGVTRDGAPLPRIAVPI